MTSPAALGYGSLQPPRLRVGVNHQTFSALPLWSTGPAGDPDAIMRAVRAAGYEALQSHAEPFLTAALLSGLTATALARLDTAADARAIARRSKSWGCDCTTLHVGTGFETDVEARRLVASVVDASTAEAHPMLIETHRATVTETISRTLSLIEDFPEVRINMDFSHWYTGAEMTYGDLDAKLQRLGPVISRTSFIHGRVSTPGCIQVPIADGRFDDHLSVFRSLWRAIFGGFLDYAPRGEVMSFYPELLPPALHYARTIPDPRGGWREESDRWEEGLALSEVARTEWLAALGARPRGEAPKP